MTVYMRGRRSNDSIACLCGWAGLASRGIGSLDNVKRGIGDRGDSGGGNMRDRVHVGGLRGDARGLLSGFAMITTCSFSVCRHGNIAIAQCHQELSGDRRADKPRAQPHNWL